MSENGSAATSRPPCFLFQSPNTVGLGHLNRLAAIACAIRDREPAAKILFLVEGDSHLLLDAVRLPYVTVPHSSQRGSESWAAWPHEEQQVYFAEAANRLLAWLRPDVVIFDTIPYWTLSKAAIAVNIPIVLCLRKFKAGGDWASLGASFLSKLSLILAAEAGVIEIMPKDIQPRCAYVGDIVRGRAETSGPLQPRTVVITGGGGGYPGTVDFYNLALAAISRLRGDGEDVAVKLVTGPLFKEWDRLALMPDVTVLPFDPALRQSLLTAGVVICQAGYNTIAELKRMPVKAICIPGERNLDDQVSRAVMTSTALPGFQVYLGGSAAGLAQQIRVALAEPRPDARADTDDRGAERAAELLLKHVGAASTVSVQSA